MGPSRIATLPPNIILASLGVDIHQTVWQNPVQYRKIRYGMDSLKTLWNLSELVFIYRCGNHKVGVHFFRDICYNPSNLT